MTDSLREVPPEVAPAAPEAAPPGQLDPLGIDPLGEDPLFANRIDGWGDGRRGAFGSDDVKLSKTYNQGVMEVGAFNQVGLGGRAKVKASTVTRDGETRTSTDLYERDIVSPGGLKEKTKAESSEGYKKTESEKTKGGLGGSTTTKTMGVKLDDHYEGVDGTVTKGKKGATETEKMSEKEKAKAKPKDAVKEAGVKKAFSAGLGNLIGRHVSMGGVGDESGIDLDDFAQQREAVASLADATAGVTEIQGGHAATASANLGPRVSGNVLAKGTDVDAFGNQRTSSAGASGQAFAGGQASAGAQHQRTETGATVGAKASAALGVGGEGAAGAKTETQLADKLSAQAGAQVKGNAFLGAKGSAGVTASHGKSNASVAGQAQAMAGVEAGGTVGGSAGIDGAGFTLAGARAQAGGQALAGVEGKASGEAKVDAIKGASASGKAEAFAGAKAEGQAKGGVSLGGVDGDAVAEGKANASAEAAASGGVTAGALGIGAAGDVEAFAGAKAGGEARFELGAGGLNLGVVGVSGEVSAGAGVRLMGKLDASLQKVGLKGRAGVTWGVGAGVGGVFSVDPSFPVRLTLNKLVHNKVIPTDDIGELIGSAASLVYKPAKAGDESPAKQEAPADPTMAPPDTGPAGAGPMLDLGAPASAEQAAPAYEPEEQMTVDALMVKATAKQREAVWGTQEAVKAGMGDAATGVLGDMREVVGSGGGLYANFMATLGGAFQLSEDVMKAAWGGMNALVQTGVQEAMAVGQELEAFGGSVVSEIQRLVTSDPKSLLDGGWEAAIDEGVARVRAFSAEIRARIQAIIERTRQAIAAVAQKAIDGAVAPIRIIVGTLGSLLGGFGAKVSGLGLSMIRRLRKSLVTAEKGVKVPGMRGVLAMPIEASPALEVAEKPVAEFATFGQQSVVSGMNAAIDFISGGLAKVLGAQSGGLLGGLATVASALTGVALDLPVKAAEGTAAVAKPVIRAAVAVARAVMQAAQRVADWFLSLFR